MPQLEISTFVPQLIWLGITFFFLYFVLSKVILPRIGGIIEERQDRIADDLDRADQFRNEAETALAAYEQALSEARNRAMGIAQDTREQVKAETDALRKDADAQIAKRLREAEDQIAATKTQAMAHVQEVATDAAKDIVAKLIDVSVDDHTASAAVAAHAPESV